MFPFGITSPVFYLASERHSAHQMKNSICAQGVETDHELAVVEEHGCDAAQGYLLGATPRQGGLTSQLNGKEGCSIESDNSRIGAGIFPITKTQV